MKKFKNNPFMIRHNRRYPRPGESVSDHGLCTFVSEYYGIRAAVKTLFYSFRSFGFCNIHDIVKHFHPIPQASKDYYLLQICHDLNTGPYKVLDSTEDYAKLLVCIARLNEYPVSIDQVFQVLDDLSIEKALKYSYSS